MQAIDIYGLSEIIGPGVANECIETKDGLTCGKTISIRRSSIPRPAPCCPTASWRTGFHHAHQGGAAGDPLPDARPYAPVARHRPLHAADGTITGRSDDMLIIRGVNVFPSQIEELILADPPVAALYAGIAPQGPSRPPRSGGRRPAPQATDAGQAEPPAPRSHPPRQSMIGVSDQCAGGRCDGIIERSVGKANRLPDFRPKD